MENLVINYEKFKNLEVLALSPNTFNMESELYRIKEDNQEKILKRLYPEFAKEYLNKKNTIQNLLNIKESVKIDGLVMPEKFAVVDDEVIGFTMPYIPNINLIDILDSYNYDIAFKIDCFKQIGEILNKMKNLRESAKITDFYLNDIHESNFILNIKDSKINVVDLDSCKIGNNLTVPSKYLGYVNNLSAFSKYKKLDANESLGGIYKINEDTEIYCYIIMILNLLYDDNIQKLSPQEYFDYLEYLKSLGISNNLLDKFSYIYTNHANENPYEYLGELIPAFLEINNRVFTKTRKRCI